MLRSCLRSFFVLFLALRTWPTFAESYVPQYVPTYVSGSVRTALSLGIAGLSVYGAIKTTASRDFLSALPQDDARDLEESRLRTAHHFGFWLGVGFSSLEALGSIAALVLACNHVSWAWIVAMDSLGMFLAIGGVATAVASTHVMQTSCADGCCGLGNLESYFQALLHPLTLSGWQGVTLVSLRSLQSLVMAVSLPISTYLYILSKNSVVIHPRFPVQP